MSTDFLSSLNTDQILHSLDSIIDQYSSMLPVSSGNLLLFCLILAAFMLGLGFIFRLFFGEHCLANRSISGFGGVLFIYTITVIIYALKPWNLEQYLSPLPFAYFRKDILILSFGDYSSLSVLSSQLLSLIILCFIVQFLSFILPSGNKIFFWLILRVFSTALAIFLFLSANWGLNTFLPDFISKSGPVILLGVLVITLLISLFNPILCILFTVANPIVGILYTFFFSNTIGKQLSRAVLSAILVGALFFVLEYTGHSVFDITASAILSYIPFAAVMLGIWYVFDSKL